MKGFLLDNCAVILIGGRLTSAARPTTQPTYPLYELSLVIALLNSNLDSALPLKGISGYQ